MSPVDRDGLTSKFSMYSYERTGWLGSRDLGFFDRDLREGAGNFAIWALQPGHRDGSGKKSSLQTADVFPVVASLPPKNNVCEWFRWRKAFLANHSLALKIKEQTGETSRKIVRSGYVYKSKLKGRRSLCTAALFSQNDAFTKANLPWLWDWLIK